MIRVVIDTNVVVSANLVDAGPSAAIFHLAVNRKMIRMCISPAVLAEYEEVLKRPRLKLAPDKIAGAVASIRNAARMVHPIATLQISRHDSDNRFYECAEAAQADYLITGNTRDFGQDHGVTKVITPRDFVERERRDQQAIRDQAEPRVDSPLRGNPMDGVELESAPGPAAQAARPSPAWLLQQP